MSSYNLFEWSKIGTVCVLNCRSIQYLCYFFALSGSTVVNRGFRYWFCAFKTVSWNQDWNISFRSRYRNKDAVWLRWRFWKCHSKWSRTNLISTVEGHCKKNSLFLPYINYCNLTWASTYASYLEPRVYSKRKTFELSPFLLHELVLSLLSRSLIFFLSIHFINFMFLVLYFHTLIAFYLPLFPPSSTLIVIFMII